MASRCIATGRRDRRQGENDGARRTNGCPVTRPHGSYCRVPLYVALQLVVPHGGVPEPVQTLAPLPQLAHPSKWTAAVALVQLPFGDIWNVIGCWQTPPPELPLNGPKVSTPLE